MCFIYKCLFQLYIQIVNKKLKKEKIIKMSFNNFNREMSKQL